MRQCIASKNEWTDAASAPPRLGASQSRARHNERESWCHRIVWRTGTEARDGVELGGSIVASAGVGGSRGSPSASRVGVDGRVASGCAHADGSAGARTPSSTDGVTESPRNGDGGLSMSVASSRGESEAPAIASGASRPRMSKLCLWWPGSGLIAENSPNISVRRSDD